MNIDSNLKNVTNRIEKAAQRSGKDLDEITLIAVTKNIDSATICKSIDFGITGIGESRAQEFRKKYSEIEKPIRWHFIGHLQSNKVKDIIDDVALVHSLDRMSLAKELNKRARRIDRVVPALVQVNISRESTKSGVYEEELLSFLDSIAHFEHIKIKGLMTIAPHTSDVEETRPYFAKMKKLYEKAKSQQYDNMDMQYLSMGMTNDFEVAIEEGANMVRIGRAIFGDRM